MGARTLARDSVLLTDPDSLRATLFVKGDDIPDRFEVGDHLFTEEPDWEGNPATGGVVIGAELLALQKASGGDEPPAELSDDEKLVAGNVGAVLDRVGDDAEKAAAVLEAEQRVAKAQKRDPRKGVVEAAQKVIDNASSGS